MHQHDHSCGCGHEHHHEHGENCGCGHAHHEHGEHCGCGHDHHHEHIEILPVEGMSIVQQNILLALYERHFLPVARFVLSKAGEDDVQASALAPVYMGTPQDTMEDVKALGAQLQQLEDGGLITLDYDLPLSGYGYAEYTGSGLYAYFQKTVSEAAGTPDFLFDTAGLELGSMALTDAGEKTVKAMIPA